MKYTHKRDSCCDGVDFTLDVVGILKLNVRGR